MVVLLTDNGVISIYLMNFIITLLITITILVLAITYLERKMNKDYRYDVLEELALNKLAKDKGFDIEEEILKRKVETTKTFKKHLQDKIIEEYFEKKEKKK